MQVKINNKCDIVSTKEPWQELRAEGHDSVVVCLLKERAPWSPAPRQHCHTAEPRKSAGSERPETWPRVWLHGFFFQSLQTGLQCKKLQMSWPQLGWNCGSEQDSHIYFSFSALLDQRQLLPLWHSVLGEMWQMFLCIQYKHVTCLPWCDCYSIRSLPVGPTEASGLQRGGDLGCYTLYNHMSGYMLAWLALVE